MYNLGMVKDSVRDHSFLKFSASTHPKEIQNVAWRVPTKKS